MKKTLSFTVPFFCLVASINFSCGGDDDGPASVSCENAVNKYTVAINAYIDDFENVNKCEAVKKALRDLIACPGLTIGQRAEYQAEVDDIECS